jgi:hypothetical protein
MRFIPNGSGVLPESPPVPRPAAGLRRFAVPRTSPRPGPPPTASPSAHPAAPEDHCELCGEQLGAEHKHLVDARSRSIACACTACALLFTRSAGWSVPTGKGSRYQTIPDRVRHDPDTPLTDAEWAELRIPVAVAFFFVNSALGHVVASYPSPAGVTECELDLAAWDRLARTHPLLRAVAPDVEAILVVRAHSRITDGDSDEMFLIPVDMCYSLAGALRLNWHGFDGGAEVRAIMAEFLGDIRRRARTLEA